MSRKTTLVRNLQFSHASPTRQAHVLLTVDVFSDGTPVRQTDGIEKHPASAWVSLMLQSGARRPIPANPSAGSIHAREAGAPWRRAGEAAVSTDTDAAKVALSAKHYSGLAHQTAAGLLRQHGLKIDASALAVDLREAAKVRSRIAQLEEQYTAAKEAVLAAVKEEAEHAAEQAALRAADAELLRMRTIQAEEEAAAAAGGRKGGKGGKSGSKKSAAPSEAAEERARIAAMDDGEMQVAADAVGAAAAAAAREETQSSAALPARPEHDLGSLKAVELLEAVSRHDLLGVIRLMGLRSKRREDRTMSHVSGAARALPSRHGATTR